MKIYLQRFIKNLGVNIEHNALMLKIYKNNYTNYVQIIFNSNFPIQFAQRTQISSKGIYAHGLFAHILNNGEKSNDFTKFH